MVRVSRREDTARKRFPHGRRYFAYSQNPILSFRVSKEQQVRGYPDCVDNTAQSRQISHKQSRQ